MKRYLYLPACLLVAVAVLHSLFAARWAQIDIVLAGVGGGLLLVAAGLTWNEIREWFADPRGIFVVNSAVSVVVLLAILVMVNLLAQAHPKRVDLTAAGRNTLTPGTSQFLSKIDRDIALRQFGRSHDPQLDQLLASFAEANGHVKLEFVDVDRNLREARAYGVAKPNGTIIVSVGEKARDGQAPTVRFRKVDQPNEPALVTAMLQVLNNRQATLCFVTGHGEHGLLDQSATGLSRVAMLLQVSNFELRRLSLLDESVPAGCAAVVVAGPQQALQHLEVDRLDEYVRAGGRVAVLLDPAPPPSLVSWLGSWGIVAQPGAVFDGGGGQLADAGPDSLLITAYGGHPITNGFEVATAFNGTCPLAIGASIKGGEPQIVAQSGPRSFITPREDISNAEFDSRSDRRGPATVVIATEPGVANIPVDARRSDKGRLVAFGDSDFISNGGLLRQGNRDLFLRTVSWLVGEKDITVVNVGERQNRRVDLTQTMKAAMFLVNLLCLPLIPLIAGIVAVLRGKR
jgi:ABC-type uncharacterized transport system involved in gliding motility auxiliary subunit